MRPDIDEMLQAVRWTIEEALLPEIAGPYARFQALIALDLLDLIGRQWATTIGDLTADVHDYAAALRVCLERCPGDLAAGQRAALAATLADPLPANPAAFPDLTARANHLARLTEAVLTELERRPEAGTSAARAALRGAVLAHLERLQQRQAGLDIRR